MKNWLEITVGLYLLGMILYGHYRGVIRMAVSMVALIAAFLIARMAMPSLAGFVKDETPVYGWIQERLENSLIPEIEGHEFSDESSLLENLNLPKEIRDMLTENSSHDLYETLGINVFAEYISSYIAGLIINAVGFVLLFCLVYVAVQIIMRWLDLMAKLPIVSGVNKIAGALLGGIQGLLFIWLLLLLVTAFSRSGWANAILVQVESSKWLSFLYHFNFLSKLVLGFVKGIL